MKDLSGLEPVSENSTGIGRGGISLGSMAVKLAEENIDDIKSKTRAAYRHGRSCNNGCKVPKEKGDMHSMLLVEL